MMVKGVLRFGERVKVRIVVGEGILATAKIVEETTMIQFTNITSPENACFNRTQKPVVVCTKVRKSYANHEASIKD